MLKEERQQIIINLLRQQGKVRAANLTSQLHVSEDTIRRDLDELAAAGILQRVHGGALPRASDLPYEQRIQKMDTARRAIAELAASLFHDGQLIFMDSGTTVSEIATCLPASLQATIVTNNLPLAAALCHHEGVEVQVLGGQLKKSAQAMIGVPVVESIRQFRADLCILGVCSLHPDIGISTLDADEAYIKRAMIEQAAEIAAVADASKLGTAASYVIGPLNTLTYLITDNSLESHHLTPYQEQGIVIMQA